MKRLTTGAASAFVVAATLAGCTRQDLDGIALTAPARVSARSDANGRIQVNWEPVLGAHAYRVYWGEGEISRATWEAAGGTVESSANSSTVLVVPFDVQYSMVVTAISGGIESADSPRVHALSRNVPLLGNEPDQLLPEPTNAQAEQGTALAAGDINCDGRDDLVIGAPETGTGSAKVHLATGLALSPTRNRVVSGSGDSGFGSSVSVGNVSGGTCADFLVGGPRDNNSRGVAFLYNGDEANIANQLWSESGDDNDDLYGDRVATLGDVDGDGIGDFAVTIPGPGQNHVVFHSGDNFPSNTPFATLDALGGAPDPITVFPIADLDGNGRVEVLVGVPGLDTGLGGEGHVEIFSYIDGAFSPLWTNDGGGQENDAFGFSATTLDLNGDLLEDLVIGSPGHSNGLGALDVFLRTATGFGASPDFRIAGEASGAQFAFALASAGDVDDNGDDDLFVSSPTAETGRVHLFYANAGTPFEEWSVDGPEAGARFGHALATGDFDGDGTRDLAVGAPLRTATPGPNTGEVSIFLTRIGLGPLADAGESLRGAPGESLAPQGAWLMDRAQRRQWKCTWDPGDLSAPTVIDPCTPQTAGDYHHAWAMPGRYELRLRVERVNEGVTAGIYGEAATTVIIE